MRLKKLVQVWIRSSALIVFLLFLLPFSIALNQCEIKPTQDDIPCLLLLPSNIDCTAIAVSFYNESTLLDVDLMETYSPSLCSAVFNYTEPGTYNYNYTTGDTGSIFVQGGNTMIYLLYFGIILAIVLMILGLYLNNQPIIAIDGILLLTVGYWIFKNGFQNQLNVMTDAVGLVGIGVGGYFLIMATLAMVDGEGE